MPTKKRKPVVAKGLPKHQRKWSNKRRIKEAAIRVLAKREKMTIPEARALYKNGYVELVIESERKQHSQWIEISPGKFRRLPPGKRKEVDAVGPVVSRGTVTRSIKMAKYWTQVRILAEEYGVSESRMRKLIRDGLVDPNEYSGNVS